MATESTAAASKNATDKSASHNFPINLNIRPLDIGQDAKKREEEARWIDEYGIAGRVWEATPYLMQYLQPPISTERSFDPPCSIFTDATASTSAASTSTSAIPPLKIPRILELGSGNGHLALHHLSPLLSEDTLLILTDLEEVVPLLDENVQLAHEDHRISTGVQVEVEALPWGSTEHADTVRKKYGEEPFTHIVCSDLVYFTHLLEPLLESLLSLTEEDATREDDAKPIEIIFGYKIRAPHKEQSFWETLGAFFDLEAVHHCPPVKQSEANSEVEDDDDDDDDETASTSSFEEDRLLILLARRKKGKTWSTKEDKKTALMSHKDGQFELIVMLKSFGSF